MRRPVLSALLLGTLLLAGCSSGDSAGGDAAAGTPPATTATTAPATATGAPSGGGPAGCPAGGTQPAGATTAPTIDVDGDGRPDTAWIADTVGADGSVAFGVTTASGGTFSADIESASPRPRSVLVADVTGDGELVALASDGRQVLLYGISDCQLVPELNPQGEPYAFDLGFTGFGTGVGCADVDSDGTRDLVGLQTDGTSVTSTVVRLDGPRAANTDTAVTVADAGPAQVDLAHQVTCGDRTLAADGVAMSG